MRRTTITYEIDDDGHAYGMRIRIIEDDKEITDVRYTSAKHFENDVREHFRI
jgi:hypothetical protein